MLLCRIPAVGFRVLVPGHHVPVHPAKSLLENEEKRGPGRVAHSNLVGQSFVKSRRCMASRTKMKNIMFLEFQFHFRLGDDEEVSLSYKMTSGGGSYFVS